jgi:hypothetical protein
VRSVVGDLWYFVAALAEKLAWEGQDAVYDELKALATGLISKHMTRDAHAELSILTNLISTLASPDIITGPLPLGL